MAHGPKKSAAQYRQLFRRKSSARFVIRCALCLAVLCCLCGPAAFKIARADTVTPSLTTSLGYTDNVRFRSIAVADGFVSVTPGFTMDYGKPNRKLTATGSLRYSEYFKHPELSQLENVSLDATYFHAFSRKTNLTVGDRGSSTYDTPVFDDTGGLVRIRTDGGRRDQNRTFARAEHGWGRNNMVWLGYAFIVTRYSQDTERNSEGNEADAGVHIRHNETWESRLSGTGSYVDYNAQRDDWRTSLQYELFYNLGKTKKLTFLGRYANSIKEQGYQQRGVDYEVYTAQVGYSHQISPKLDWSLLAGMSAVVGQSDENSRNDKDYPAITLSVTWREKDWSLKFQGETSVGEFDIYGSDSGLTFRKRASLIFTYDITRHWRLATEASYVDNNYTEDPLVNEGSDSDITSYRGLAKLSWQTTRDWNVNWEYLYQESLGEQDSDNRRENQFLMSLTGKIPYRW